MKIAPTPNPLPTGRGLYCGAPPRNPGRADALHPDPIAPTPNPLPSGEGAILRGYIAYKKRPFPMKRAHSFYLYLLFFSISTAQSTVGTMDTSSVKGVVGNGRSGVFMP